LNINIYVPRNMVNNRSEQILATRAMLRYASATNKIAKKHHIQLAPRQTSGGANSLKDSKVIIKG